MPSVKLTDAAAKRLTAPTGERVDYFDAAFPGLALRVTGPAGQRPERRVWSYFYRHHGKQKRLTIGRYPDVSLAEARQEATRAQVQIRSGIDPATAREKQGDTTVATVAESFIRLDLERRKRSPRYVNETRRIFANHVLPRWGDRDIKTITRREVIELLDSVMESGTVSRDADGKRRKLAGGPIIANRTLAAVRALLNWSLRRGMIDATPAALVEAPGEETKRDRVLTEHEVRAIWSACGAMGYPFGDFYRLAMLTGQRRQEVAKMRWDEIDLDAAVWNARTKGGKTNVVPLAPLAVEILKGLPRIAGGFVFTTTGNTPISGFSKAKERIDHSDPLPPWRNHDMRRTAATEMGRHGVTRFIIERVLNHSDRSVTAIYDRYSYLEEKRQALETWADYLASITQQAPSIA